VRYIHDGDTLHLSDGRKIRLIGINAPELARGTKPEQPYARAARDNLISAVTQQGQKVGLVYDRERKDKYGRTLAHLFLENGSNLQAMLITEGLATAYVVPPNNRFAQCYARFERLAQCENRRIWSQPNYIRHPVTTLNKNAHGFHRLHGRVLEVQSTRKGYWLSMENNLRVQIRQQDLKYFDTAQLKSFAGKTIGLRGWLHPNKTGYYLSVRHPAAIELAMSANCEPVLR